MPLQKSIYLRLSPAVSEALILFAKWKDDKKVTPRSLAYHLVLQGLMSQIGALPEALRSELTDEWQDEWDDLAWQQAKKGRKHAEAG